MDQDAARSTPTWHLVVLAALVSIVPSFIAVVLLDGGFEEYPDARTILIDFVAPHAVVGAVLAGYVWWRTDRHRVLTDDERVRAWVWVVPASLVVGALLVTDWGRLLDAGPTALLGLVGVLLAAANEEVVFRGVFLAELRRRTTETRAAWLSSIMFGLIHLLGGPVQVVVSILVGHVFYYCRRVSGGLVVPIVAHTAWNFSLLSSYVSSNPDERATSSAYLTLLTVALLVALGLGRKRIAPTTAP